jgi:PAS domain-containing protein
MQIAQNYYIYLPLAAFLAALVMVVVVARHRTMRIETTFSVLMSTLAVWSLAVVLEHASLELSAKIFWMKMSYLGILSLPISWLVLTLRYANKEQWLSRRNLVLLAVLPTITLVLVWTNDMHHLMWKDIWLDTSYSPPIDDVTHGAWFWIQAAYSYLLIFLGTLVLARVYLHASTVHRKQVGVMLVGALVPWVANILYIAPIRLFQVLDPTPLAFAITGVAFSWGLFRLRLLDIMPIAQETVFRNMVDGVVVLDAQGRIAELNPAAQRIVARARAGAVGQPYGVVLPALAGRLQLGSESTELQYAVSLSEVSTLRHYAVSVSPIITRYCVLPSSCSTYGWVKWFTALQHAISNIDELAHHRSDDDHLEFAVGQESGAEGSDNGVVPDGCECRHIQGFPDSGRAGFGQHASAMHRCSRLAMPWRKAAERGHATRIREARHVAEFGQDHSRSARSDTGDSLEQIALAAQVRMAIDVVSNLLGDLVDAAFDESDHVLD